LQLHEAKLSAQELASKVPKRMQANELLQENIVRAEQELLTETATLSENDKFREDLLEQAALVIET